MRSALSKKVLHGGKQEGSKILTIHSKDGLTITLQPNPWHELTAY